MSVNEKKTFLKRRSQLPVALAYFGSTLLFLIIFGLMAIFLVQRVNELNKPAEAEKPAPPQAAINMLYIREGTKNDLKDMAIVRISSEKQTVVAIPLSSSIKTDDGQDFKSAYRDGVDNLKDSIKDTLGIKITNYVVIPNDGFDKVVDILGGVVYTPAEELYHLTTNDDDDILFKKSQTVTLYGKQIRELYEYPVFESGNEGNLEFMGTVLTTLVSNTFKQTSITSLNMDTMYGYITKDAKTDLSKGVYKDQKKIIMEMLKKGNIMCKFLMPSGTWEDNTLTLSQDFKDQVSQIVEKTDPLSSQKSEG
ncbi:MAG: LCP family protein [Oscillospiraceae bacterium]